MAYPRATIAAYENSHPTPRSKNSVVPSPRSGGCSTRLVGGLRFAGISGRLRPESADARRDPADARAAGRRASVRLLLAWPPPRFRGGSTGGQPWTAARSELDEAIDYLRRFYADLGACIEWSAYRYGAALQSTSWT